MRALFISLATLLALAGCRQSNNGATGTDDNPSRARTDDLERSRIRAPADLPDTIPTPNVGDPGNVRGGGGAGPSGQTGTTGSIMGDDGLVRAGGGNTTAPGATGTIGPDGGIGGGGPVMDRNPTPPSVPIERAPDAGPNAVPGADPRDPSEVST
jgi:hypothetical protein